MHTVISEKQGVGFGIGKIVDRDQFHIIIGAFQYRTRHKTTDSAKSVNCYFCHRFSSFEFPIDWLSSANFL